MRYIMKEVRQVKKFGKKETLPTSVRVTPEATAIWEALASKMGLSKAGVMETILREAAEKRGVSVSVAEEVEA